MLVLLEILGRELILGPLFSAPSFFGGGFNCESMAKIPTSQIPKRHPYRLPNDRDPES